MLLVGYLDRHITIEQLYTDEIIGTLFGQMRVLVLSRLFQRDEGHSDRCGRTFAIGRLTSFGQTERVSKIF